MRLQASLARLSLPWGMLFPSPARLSVSSILQAFEINFNPITYIKSYQVAPDYAAPLFLKLLVHQ